MSIKLGFQPDDSEDSSEFDDEGYKTVYLNKCTSKTFEGKPELIDIREDDYGNNKCYLIIKNEDEEEKLVAPIGVAIEEDEEGDELIIARKNSVLYDFVDSLFSNINGTERNSVPRYKMFIEDFDELEIAINDKIESMKVKMIPKSFEQKDKKTKEVTKVNYNSFEVKSVELV